MENLQRLPSSLSNKSNAIPSIPFKGQRNKCADVGKGFIEATFATACTPNIQEPLGHDRSKTTEIYTQISKKSLANIKNPLDRLIEEQNIDNKIFTSVKN